jgi:aryl-phospho-beta-D-glucosidase BglC (GH1 family)
MNHYKKSVKKWIAIAISMAMVLTSVLTGNVTTGSAASAPKLNFSKKTVTAGRKVTLKVKKKPAGSKILSTKWKSSNKKVATVTKKGVVKAKKAGKTKITATVRYKKGKTKKTKKLSCTITVKAKKSTTKQEDQIVVTPAPGNVVTITPNETKTPDALKTEKPVQPGATSDVIPSVSASVSAKPSAIPSASASASTKPSAIPSASASVSTKPSATPSASASVSTKPSATPAASASVSTKPSTTKPTTAPIVTPGSHLSANGIATIDDGVMRSDIDAYDIVHDMGIGINLGNTLDAVAGWLNGGGTVEDYETAWGAPVTTQEMITGMKEAGFHSIRIPVAWSNLMKDDGTYTINEDYFNRVETVMNYAFNAGMYAIVNIHYDGGWWARFGSKTESERTQAMVKYKAMWTQIANRFNEYSDHLIFEAANEELGERLNSTDDYAGSGYFTNTDDLYKQVTAINQAFVDTVRGTGGNNASRFLLIAGYNTDIAKTCDERYVMPTDTIDGHMMISVHYYSPATYCTVDDPGNSWGYRDSWGTEDDIAEMKDTLNLMRINYVNKGIPVIIGEYGVIAGKNSDGTTHRKDGRDVFISTICEYALTHGMCPVLWDINEIYSRASNTIVHSTEAANYKKFEQQALESETYRPASKSTTLTYTGSIGYSGWTPSTVTAEGDVDFSVTNQGGTFMISDVNWSDYTNPKITMTMQGATGNVTCRFAKTASGGNQYYQAIEASDVLKSTSWNFSKTLTQSLSDCDLTGKADLYFDMGGLEAFSGKITITISDAQ